MGKRIKSFSYFYFNCQIVYDFYCFYWFLIVFGVVFCFGVYGFVYGKFYGVGIKGFVVVVFDVFVEFEGIFLVIFVN